MMQDRLGTFEKLNFKDDEEEHNMGKLEMLALTLTFLPKSSESTYYQLLTNSLFLHLLVINGQLYCVLPYRTYIYQCPHT